MRPYSVDLRQRILAAVQEGHSFRNVAERFAVSAASVCRYTNQHKRTQTLTPKPIPGAKRKLDAALLASLQQRVEQKSDETLAQLHQWLLQQHPAVCISQASVYRALVRCGFTYKKSRWLLVSETNRSEKPGARL